MSDQASQQVSDQVSDSGLDRGEGGQFRPSYANLPGVLRLVLRWRDTLFWPRPDYLPAGHKGLQQFYSAMIGYLLIAFLVVMVWPYWFSAGLQPVPQLHSISAHVYHQTLGPWFTGLLFAAVIFMFLYRAENWPERLIAWFGAVGLFLLAYFPTRPKEIIEATQPLSQIRTLEELGRPLIKPLTHSHETYPWVDTLHVVGAMILFAALIVQSALVFTRWGPQDGIAFNTALNKQGRNVAYYCLALAMLITLVVAVKLYGRSTGFYWGEMIALTLFAISWLIKGRGLIGPLMQWWRSRRQG